MDLSILDQAIRIFVAIIVGGIIGLERMKFHKAAGVRTHAIITVICTMLTIVSAYGFAELPGAKDPTRLISNILTGVGFLAGGVIYVTTKKDANHIEEGVVGLTTAAGIFGAAMLGIPIGLGHFQLVILTVAGIELSLQSESIIKKFHMLKESDEKQKLE
ncbi:MAG: MgtC/SapB family protein [Clostridiaceae bacterium]|nr:MgtC/SapB family protein [Clostridiaceae bacterium]